MNAAGVGGVAHRPADVRPQTNVSDARRDAGSSTTRGSPGSQPRITWVACARAAVEQVAGKPTHGKRWHIAAPKHHCTCSHHIVYGRAVEFGDAVFVQPAAIAGGEPCLVDV